MLISHAEVAAVLKQYLGADEKRSHVPIITDLTWLAVLVSEFGYQCRPEARETEWPKLRSFINDTALGLGELLQRAQAYEISSTLDAENRQLGFEDLIVMHVKFYAYRTRLEGAAKDALFVWIEDAWNHGVQQYRISRCEIEGGVQNQVGVVTSFAAHLALFGGQSGLLPS